MIEVESRVGQLGKRGTVKFLVMAVSEDLAAWRRANGFLDKLSARLGTGAVIERNFWRVNLLRTPLLQEQAAVEAGRADLIILSFSSTTGMLEDMEKWIGRWLDHKEDRPYCLGVLQNYDLENSDSARVVIESMEHMVGSTGTVFFSCNIQWGSDVARTLATLVKQLNLTVSVDDPAMQHAGQI